MIFCYPKLSKWDLLYLRLGGSGLGNLLFPWARAKILARQHGYQFVPPAWQQLKLGPFLRGELDKRNYFLLFRCLPTEVCGFRRFKLLLLGRRVSEHLHKTAVDGDVVVISGMRDLFNDILPYSDYLHNELISMLRINRLTDLMCQIGASDSIAVHVRFGDFMAAHQNVRKQGGANCRQPIEWYAAAIDSVRSAIGENTPVNVFSDADDAELAPILSMPSVHRVRGNGAIEDILLIASHRLLIASGSTFSMWASFLGQIPTVWFPGQKKFQLVRHESSEVEFEPGNPLPPTFVSLFGR
jgi:hypothetical protein